MTNRMLTSDVCGVIAGTLIAALVCSIASTGHAQHSTRLGPPYQSEEPLSSPAIFQLGIVSTGDFDSHPTFTPDGRSLYFLQSTPDFNHWTIVVTHFEGGTWTTPEIAPFSGLYSDADPFITSDGSRFYFISNRPVANSDARNLDIWVMDRTPTGWGEPKNLGLPVNSAGNEWYPTVSNNGTIYFGSDRGGGVGQTDLYRSSIVGKKYTEPENLGEPINTADHEYEPYIAPNEGFLIFMASDRPGGIGGNDLYMSCNQNGAWSKPVNLGDKINSTSGEYSPMISPDGRYFFWTSKRNSFEQNSDNRLSYIDYVNKLRSPGNGLGDIYQVSISELPTCN